MNGRLKSINYKVIVTIFLPFFLLMASELFFLKCMNINYHIFYKNRMLLLMIIMVYSFFLFFWSIFKKTKYSLLLLSIIALVFGIVSQIKIAFTNVPFYFSDIFYVGEGSDLLGIIGNSWTDYLSPLFPAFLIYVLFIIGFIIVSFICSIDFKSTRKRVTLGSLSFLLILVFFLPIKLFTNFFLDYFYEVNSRVDYDASTSELKYFFSYGNLGGMYGVLLENRIFKDSDYDDNLIDKEVNGAIGDDGALGTPNIIVVFSESFWNIDQLEEVKFDKKVASNFEKLKEKGLFFDMISPSYGGISANVEFEFLSGGSLNYFGSGYVPYMHLYNNKKSYNYPTIIKELKNAGYKTKIVPLSSEDLFSCGKVYNYMDVDEVHYVEDMLDGKTKGFYTSDEYVTDLIIDEFNNKKAGEKLYYMTMTMQGHMPYPLLKYDDYDIDIVSSNLSEKSNEVLKSYAQGVYDADKQLGRLYDYIQNLDEPTIIVFYGDHLPYLFTSESNIMDSLEYFNTDDNLLNTFRKYNTQSIILANYDITDLKNRDNYLRYLSPDLLSSYILNNMNIEVSSYFKWLYSTRNVIGASNRLISINQDGVLYWNSELDEKMKELYNFRKNVQYKFFID